MIKNEEMQATVSDNNRLQGLLASADSELLTLESICAQLQEKINDLSSGSVEDTIMAPLSESEQNTLEVINSY